MSDRILLAHGSGGRLTRDLVRNVICAALGDVAPKTFDDAAMVLSPGNDLVFTTDSFVVTPLEFPGGDIGSLAVSGTVNDLAVMGARPLCLSLGLILEEGLELALLRRMLTSLAKTARLAGVRIACGDTKVVEKGKADGIFINTAGIGVVEHRVAPETIAEGDRILISGAIGDHGMTLLTLRKGFPLGSPLASDAAPLNGLIGSVQRRIAVKWMRDPTRGGVATALNELVENKPWGVVLSEDSLPLHPAVMGVSEILGIDPLYSANEGKALFVVRADEAQAALAIMKNHPLGIDAAIIGEVTPSYAGKLVIKTKLGTLRTMGMLAADPLPRIC
jgi:hydrogenase expression/formation protein HypE